LKHCGVIPARESVDEEPSGNDLPRAAARVAMYCRLGGDWVDASRLYRVNTASMVPVAL
jgi:hypothetical protein